MSESQLENSGDFSLPLINISALGNSQSEQDLLNSILSNTAEIDREKTNIEKGFKKHQFKLTCWFKHAQFSVVSVFVLT